MSWKFIFSLLHYTCLHTTILTELHIKVNKFRNFSGYSLYVVQEKGKLLLIQSSDWLKSSCLLYSGDIYPSNIIIMRALNLVQFNKLWWKKSKVIHVVLFSDTLGERLLLYFQNSGGKKNSKMLKFTEALNKSWRNIKFDCLKYVKDFCKNDMTFIWNNYIFFLNRVNKIKMNDNVVNFLFTQIN